MQKKYSKLMGFLIKLKGKIKGIFAIPRLKRIEKATGIKLIKWQRKIVLDPYVQTVGCGRGMGKTLISIIWALLWIRKPIIMQSEAMKINRAWGVREKMAFPDPDLTSMKRLDLTLLKFIELREKCIDSNIKVCKLIDWEGKEIL